MRQRILNTLRERRAPLKREWEGRLRREPVRNAMGEPSVLVYKMDETLERFRVLLTRSHVRRSTLSAGDFETWCGCRLNPLLIYFATGEAALLAVLADSGEINELVRAFVVSNWRSLAQNEIEVLCGLCLRVCRQAVPAVSSLVTPDVGAGGRDRR